MRQLVGCETVHEVTATVPDATMLVLSRVMSPPPPVAVTDPSMIAVPPPEYARNQPAVPVASADVSDVIAAAVATEGLAVVAAPNAVADSGSVASSVPDAAVFAVAGCEPVRISMYPAPPTSRRSTTASHAAFAAACVIFVAISGAPHQGVSSATIRAVSSSNAACTSVAVSDDSVLS
jgi:hypothetical protein